MTTPVAGTYPAYFDSYIQLVKAADIKEAIEKYNLLLNASFEQISEEKSTYRYAENKWSIKEMLQHIIDAERIFCYRALTIARGEKIPLPGFDENSYAAVSHADDRAWQSLVEEYKAVRKATDLMLLSFNDGQLNNAGITNDKPNTVIAIAYIIYGHSLHHLKVVKERYL